MARAIGSGRIRPTMAMLRSGMKSSRDLNALRFGFPTLEFLDDGVPVTAFAQQPLDSLPKRAFASAAVEFPRRRVANFGCRIGRRGGDAGAKHRSEVGQVVAEVEKLVEAKGKLLNEALARFQFVRRPLMQLVDPQLASTTAEGRRAAAGQQSDGDANALGQFRGQAISYVEFLDLARLAGVDDFSIRPNAVNVRDDDADVEGAGGHALAS